MEFRVTKIRLRPAARSERLIRSVEAGLAVSCVTDEELVAAMQSGDMQSLGQLVVRWERPLYRFVSRMVPRPEDARDVCQETFLRVLKRADRFRRVLIPLGLNSVVEKQVVFY